MVNAASDQARISGFDPSAPRSSRSIRASGHVATLAGNGIRGQGLNDMVAIQTAELASPWDLEIRGSFLFFANAGTLPVGFDFAALPPSPR